MSEPTQGTGIEILVLGIQTMVADKMLDATVTTVREPIFRSVVVNIRQNLFDRTIYKTTSHTEWRDKPGLWNALKRYIPWATPVQVAWHTDVHLHHNCPHLPTVKADHHFDWLMQEVSRGDRE